MAAPMPPEAPVTRAVLPSKRNIGGFLPSEALQNRLDVRQGSGGDTGSIRRDALDQPGQHLAGAELDEAVDAHFGHGGNAFAPADSGGDLLHQQRADPVRVG